MSAAEIAGMLAVLALAVACYSFGSTRGFVHGFDRGKAIGWLERQEELWRDEKARRDARGRFQRKDNL